jgi:hypothetical protein
MGERRRNPVYTRGLSWWRSQKSLFKVPACIALNCLDCLALVASISCLHSASNSLLASSLLSTLHSILRHSMVRLLVGSDGCRMTHRRRCARSGPHARLVSAGSEAAAGSFRALRNQHLQKDLNDVDRPNQQAAQSVPIDEYLYRFAALGSGKSRDALAVGPTDAFVEGGYFDPASLRAAIASFKLCRAPLIQSAL